MEWGNVWGIKSKWEEIMYAGILPFDTRWLCNPEESLPCWSSFPFLGKIKVAKGHNGGDNAPSLSLINRGNAATADVLF